LEEMAVGRENCDCSIVSRHFDLLSIQTELWSECVKLFSFLLLFSTLFFLIYKLLISLLSACFVQHFNSCLANKKLLLDRLNWAFLIKTDLKIAIYAPWVAIRPP
jgi:hypothetical protein